VRSKVREHRTTDALLQAIGDRKTQELTVGKGLARVTVGVREGAIVCAYSSRDEHHYIRLLYHLKMMTKERAHHLLTKTSDPDTYFDEIFQGVSDRVTTRILDQRFQENLCCYLRHRTQPSVKDVTFVYANYMMVDVGAQAVINTAFRVLDSSHGLRATTTLAPSGGSSDKASHRVILARLSDRVWTVRELLPLLPFEPTLAKVYLNDMLNSGLILRDGQNGTTAPTAPVVAAAPAAPPTPSATVAPEIEEEEEEEELDAEDMAAKMVAWFSEDAPVDEAELEMFSDVDGSRGGGESGEFTTKMKDLEHIEVNHLDASDDA